ncbi:MAG: BACON domain-containing protein [Acidobacteriia bacterium]|nr:BACON domain-containing protein [Terriglobia bacterium]
MKLFHVAARLALAILSMTGLCTPALAACSAPISILPAAPTFHYGSGAGGPNFVTITAGMNGSVSCTWTAKASGTFITASPLSGGGGSANQFVLTFSVSANPDLASRTGNIVITQSDQTTATVNIIQDAAIGDFSISADPVETATPGGTALYNISVVRFQNFTGAVSLALLNPPSGVGSSFSTNPVTGISSTMTLTVATNVAPGIYPMTLKGTNGNVNRSIVVTLNVANQARSSLVTFVDPTFASGASQDIFYVGNDQHIRHIFATSAWQQEDLTALSAGPAAAASSPVSGYLDSAQITGTAQHIFYLSSNNHVHHLFGTAGAWHDNDITTLSGATAVGAGSPLSSFLDPTSSTGFLQSVFYLGTDQHVHRISLSGTTWQSDDLTVRSNAPLAMAGSPLSSFVDANGVTGSPIGVFYLGTDKHVHHIFEFPSGWQTDDLTALSGAPAATFVSSLSTFLDASSATGARQNVYYIGSDQHVHHIFAFTSTGTWQTDDISAITGAPSASAGSSISSFLDRTFLTGAAQAVFYFGTDGHVNHIFGTATGWQRDDISSLSQALAAESGSPVSSFLDNTLVTGASQGVFYVGTDHHVHHIFAMSTWQTDDLTALSGAVPVN